MVDFLQSNLDRTTRISLHSTAGVDGAKSVEIGMAQSIDHSEGREITAHYSLGNLYGDPEVPKVLIDGLVNKRTLNLKALALFKNNILMQFGDPNTFIVSLRQQRTPFDVQVVKTKAGDPTQQYTITYKKCMIADWSYNQDIGSGAVTIVENATIVYTDVVGA